MVTYKGSIRKAGSLDGLSLKYVRPDSNSVKKNFEESEFETILYKVVFQISKAFLYSS